VEIVFFLGLEFNTLWTLYLHSSTVVFGFESKEALFERNWESFN